MVKMEKQPIDWITVNGNHVPIFEGESKKDAISSFIKDKSPMQKDKSLLSGAGSEEDKRSNWLCSTPFAICEELGIPIQERWTPNDAWMCVEEKTGKSIDFYYKEYKQFTLKKEKRKAKLRKSIRSYTKRIKEHQEKIKNPQGFIKDWEEKPQEYKLGIIARWEKEIKNFENQIQKVEEELNGHKN